jgi:DDE superfamily endonuclease/Helix-turn-helix of DDE superfamily endonuclease
MLDFDRLAARPAAFLSLTGLTPAEFEALLADFAPVYTRHRAAADRTRRGGRPRRRAPGAGGQYARPLRDRLLLALVWLKAYPTYELLGLLFGLHKRNAQLNARDVLEALELLDGFPFDDPDPGRRAKLGTVAAVMEAFPAVRVVIDSKEQRVYRPGGGHARQKPYYSGKKKAHTVKTQLAVSPEGVIVSVSPGVPGSVNDVRLLRQTGRLGRLADGEQAMTDKGYEGAENDHPDAPGGYPGRVVRPKKDRKRSPLTDADKAANRVVSRHRVVVEHTIAQANRFTVLRQVFRGRLIRHHQVTRAVAGLVNRRTRARPLAAYPLAAYPLAA